MLVNPVSPTSYIDLAQFTRGARAPDADEVLDALEYMRGASRFVEEHLIHRIAYQLEGRTLHLDIDRPVQRQWRLPLDCVTLTTVKADSNLDGTFDKDILGDSNFTTRLLPFEPPSDYLDVYPTPALPVDEGRLEVKADWGWPRQTVPTVDTVRDNPMTDSQLTLEVLDGNNYQPGQSLWIGTEQVVLADKVGFKTYSVERGANGTTAAAHAQGTAISRITFPGTLIIATQIVASRLWVGRDSGFASVVSDSPVVEPSSIIDKRLTDLTSSLRRYF